MKRSARRHAEQLLCTCPGDPQTLSDEFTKSTTSRTDPGVKGKESPHLSRYEQGNDIPVVQMDYAFLHDTGDKEAKVTFLTMVDNSSGQMVATAVQKKGHDKFVERFLLKGLESFGVTGEMVTGPIDVAKHVAAERKATSSIRQTPKKSSQSNAYVERAHQSVEAMVRTIKEVIEDKAHTRLSATDNITSWMIRHPAFLQTHFSVGKNCKTPFKRRHHKDYTSQLLPFGSAVDAKVRDEETESSKLDSRFIPGISLGKATESDEHIVGTAQGVYTARSARAKNDQEIWNSGLIKSMKGTPWAPRGEDSQTEVRMPEERHKPMIGWNTNTRMLRDFWGEMGKTAGCAACASPGGKKHNVACLNWQEEWKNRTIPQPENVTRETDAEMQQDNQAPGPSSSAHTPSTGIGDSTVRPIARHIRDTEQLENANDEPENPRDWAPAKRIRLKSKPLVQSKRPRETPTDLNTWKTTGCGEWEQAALQTKEKVISQKRRW